MSRRVAEEGRGRRADRPSFRCLRAPTRDAATDPWGPLPRLWAAGSVPRAGLKPAPTENENSTDVRLFQEGWRKWRIRPDWWGEIAQAWGWDCACAWHARGRGLERMAQERDAFFRGVGAGMLGMRGIGEIRVEMWGMGLGMWGIRVILCENLRVYCFG